MAEHLITQYGADVPQATTSMISKVYPAFDSAGIAAVFAGRLRTSAGKRMTRHDAAQITGHFKRNSAAVATALVSLFHRLTSIEMRMFCGCGWLSGFDNAHPHGHLGTQRLLVKGQSLLTLAVEKQIRFDFHSICFDSDAWFASTWNVCI